MKIRQFILSLFFGVMLPCALIAQEQPDGAFDKYFRIAQKPNTQQQLKDFLSPLPPHINHIYVTLFQPQMCPRCETDINSLYNYIKAIDSSAIVVLWPNHPNIKSVLRYIENKNFLSDFVLPDSTENYLEIFSITPATLSIPFTLKIDRENGRLMFGGGINLISDETYQYIYNVKEHLDFHDFETNLSESKTIAATNSPILTHKSIKLEESEKYSISTMLEYPSFKDGMLCFCDELNNTFYTYKIDGSKIAKRQNVFETRLDEETRFIDTSLISIAQYLKMKRNNEVFVMPCKGIVKSDTLIYLSYSLPNLMRSPFDSSNISYFNAASFFKWNPLTNSRTLLLLKLINPTDGIEKIVFFADHTTFHSDWDNNAVIRASKGYPQFGIEINEWTGNPADFNPLIPEFYEKTPLFYIYDIESNKKLGEYGKLDNIYQHHKVGYRFVRLPSFDYNNSYIAYTCGTSGIVHVASRQNPDSEIASINVFTVDTSRITDTPGNTQYLNKLEKKIFKNSINSIKLSGNKIVVLSTEDGTTFLRLYTVDGMLLKEGTLVLKQLRKKRNNPSSMLSDFYIYSNNGELGAYTLFREKGVNYLAMFPI